MKQNAESSVESINFQFSNSSILREICGLCRKIRAKIGHKSPLSENFSNSRKDGCFGLSPSQILRFATNCVRDELPKWR
ncbi:hypothetical protein [Helicobacter sp. 23-1045]